jgi:hypothetical protein
MKHLNLKHIFCTLLTCAVAINIFAIADCDYTDNRIAPGEPHCHDLTAAVGSGWTFYGTCHYLYCDSSVPCSGQWTMKIRVKLIVYKIVGGVTTYATDHVTDGVEGCCLCNSTYVERTL